MIDKLMFLLEATGEQIQKYYSKVPINIYNQILMADPTAIIKNNEVKKVGKYSKTVLDIWLKTKFDINLAKPALESWHTNAKLIKTQLSKAKTIDDIMQWSQNASLQVTAEKESKIVAKSGDMILRQILSKAAAIFYGKFSGMKVKPTKFQSNWCTSYPKGSYYDNMYAKDKGDLYILAKTNGELIAQLFFGKDGRRTEYQKNNNTVFDIKSLNDNFKKYIFKKHNIDADKNNSFEFQGHTIDPIWVNDTTFEADEIILDHSDFADFTELPWDADYKWYAMPTCQATNCNMTSLKNKNFISAGILDVTENNITSLEGMPDCVNFYIEHNKLTSFKGLKILKHGGSLIFANNKITSFKYFPKISSHSLEQAIDCAIDGIDGINVSNNSIKSLEGCPPDMFMANFNIEGNQLKNLDFMPKNITNLVIDKKWKSEAEKLKATNNIIDIIYF